MANMSTAEKERIFEMNRKRTERDIIRNTGIEVYLGDEAFNLKALTWKKSNDFENAFVIAARKLTGMMKTDVSTVTMADVLDGAIEILQNDLVTIATLATDGYVTMEKIEATNASKNDVMEIVVEAFKLNYSYIKNLLALTQALK